MIEKRKLLIATSNEGKLEEIKQFLDTLPFELIGLQDLKENIPEPEETELTVEGNAILKAKYYGEKTGIMSLADDGGLFVDALDGWPGVKSARIADIDENRTKTVLDKMNNIENRKASFIVGLALYDPDKKTVFVTEGETRGTILKEVFVGGTNNYGFNPIFFVDDMKKVYAEMSLQEKNSVSHRGKALNKIKHYLQNQYRARDIVVPISLVIKDGKILSNLRNDPHRPEYHKKWEFPGGGMEIGENMQENLIRETKEEAGYDIEIIKMLQYIHVEYQKDYNYQVYLVPYVCKIVGGDGVYSDAEVLEMEFFELDELLNKDLVGENKKLYTKLLPELKEVIKEYAL